MGIISTVILICIVSTTTFFIGWKMGVKDKDKYWELKKKKNERMDSAIKRNKEEIKNEN